MIDHVLWFLQLSLHYVTVEAFGALCKPEINVFILCFFHFHIAFHTSCSQYIYTQTSPNTSTNTKSETVGQVHE